jgi:ABC-type sugar transport system substrate-binding protein
LIAVLSLTVAACGSSSSNSSSSSSSTSSGSSSSGSSSGSTGSSPGVAAAKAAIAGFTSDPTSIYPTVKITKPIPKGKTIVYINCGAPACTNIGTSFTQAAHYLGWTVSNIVATPTPQGIQTAFQNAIRMHPAGVISGGFASTQYPEQLKELTAAHIPVLSDTGTDPTGANGITLQVLPPDQTDKATALLADQTIADDGGSGHVGVVFLTGYPIVKDYTDSYVAELKKNCPKCTMSTLTVDPTAITNGASKIASFLAANPGIKQLFISYDGLAVGLPAAVKGAGVTYPKTYSWAPDQTGVAALQSGARTASVPLCYPDVGYQFADALARLFTGGSIQPDTGFEHFVIWDKQYNDVPTQANNPPCDANYASQFEALWK